MIDLSKATCATCPFWDTEEKYEDGECPCVCRPPVLTHNGTEWPTTKPTNYCGEHPIRRAAYDLAVQAAKEAGTNG